MSKTLLLFPTTLEANKIVDGELKPRVIASLNHLPGQPNAAICGFGLPVAAALSSQLINACKPGHIILMGIAGTYHRSQAPIGSVVQGSSVRAFGIGSGQGQSHVGAVELGFDPHEDLDIDGQSITLRPISESLLTGEIISVAAASANQEEAMRIETAHPIALLEDMETYSVALAAHLANCPISVVRGVSNRVGERNKGSWKVMDALEALHDALPDLLSAAL